jgi:hypothetical protein
MQLKKIKGKVTLATCTLLQVGATASQAGDLNVDSSFLYYSESDSRVTAFEPAVRVKADLGDDESIDFLAVLDALTGATPNGAHKSRQVQTFTNPSGNGSYTVQPGEFPLSSTFQDTRVALKAEWDKPLNRLSSVLMGASLSAEVDYTSLGISSTYQRDFNNKNTTLAAGVALTFDTINPIGEIPKGLNPMRVGGSDQQRVASSDTKESVDLMIGFTQIVSRKTLFQLNYTFATSSGYLNDYNNVLSVVNPDGTLTTAPWVASGTSNLPYLFEQRPDSRNKNILFFRGVHHLTEDVINVSYRYFTDDWGINSHTLDFRYRYQLTPRQYLQPHMRYYTQSKADFYRHDLVQGSDVSASGVASVQYASSDYRVGAFDSTTLGLSYGMKFTKNSEFTIRGELMQQKIDNSEVPRAGEETPDLTAVIFSMGYNVVF